MVYNWQQEDWPNFTYEEQEIDDPKIKFGISYGQLSGILVGLPKDIKSESIIELMVNEAIKSSEIEGEFLSRQEVMSSIKKNLGVHDQQPKQIKDHRAKGIAQLMVMVRKTYSKPLNIQMLFDWHKVLMTGNKRVATGTWRTHTAPMEVVSGSIGRETVHFEAPPSDQMDSEMVRFIQWFNDTAPEQPLAINNPLVRSAIAHLYFESIHPFEDGNGRIGRAISEKALSQGLGQPVLLSLSTAMEANKTNYYNSLKQGQRSNQITKWIKYFIKTVWIAQEEAEKLIHFSLKKTQFFDRNNDVLNDRQKKVINRMLAEGPAGFDGGMSAKKYIAIAKTSKATATRDLQQLASLGIFIASGGGRSVSYSLEI